jgi:hypothetical protein
MMVFPGATAYFDSNDSYTAYAESSDAAPAAPLLLKAERSSDTALKLKWSKVKGASGYVVYQCNPGSKKYKMVKTIKGQNKTTFTSKKLATDKTYRYKVRSYKATSGKKTYSAFSYSVSARAFSSSTKTANVNKITVDLKASYLGIDAIKQISASAVVKSKNKKPLSEKIRWLSSNTSLVTITKSGYIHSQGKAGACYVYAIAHNGYAKKIKVTVKDFANPALFTNLEIMKKKDSKAYDVFVQYQEDFKFIASYLEKYTKKTRYYYDYENQCMQALGGTIPSGEYWARMETFLRDTGVEISLNKGVVDFTFPAGSNSVAGMYLSSIFYSDNNSKPNNKDTFKIAPCWYYIYTNGGGDTN